MNVKAIESTSATQQAAAARPPAGKAPQAAAQVAGKAQPPAAPAVSVRALLTPAATNGTTSVPATVKPEDRALYLQILKSLGGNVTAALAALAALEAKQS